MAEISLGTTVALNDGHKIPILGFGVFLAEEGEHCQRAVRRAIEVGYRHIDTASEYGNEASVGSAIAEAGVPRGEIFLTTKYRPSAEVASVRTDMARSLEKLRTDYVDLYLIHWPIACYKEAWPVLIELQKEGLCRSIGVSNYTVQRFKQDFFSELSVSPAVNQVELNVFNQRRDLVEYCAAKGIAVEAYRPLANGDRLDDSTLLRVSRAFGKTPAQVMIRYLLQKGFATIPKSTTPSRIKENIEVFDFELSLDDMSALDALNDNAYYSLTWRPEGFY